MDRRKKHVTILTCSANLGNAQPDNDSLASWIPEDGKILSVLKDPPAYPVRYVDSPESFQTFEVSEYDEQDQFDLVVIGMQEASFEPPRGITDETNPGSSKNDRVRVRLPAVKPLKKVQKTVRGISALTANRDYVKRPKQESQWFDIDRRKWDNGTEVLHRLLEARLPSYERQVSFQRGEMRLEVFVLDGTFVKVLNVKAQNTGRAGLANKGGILAELMLRGRTRLAFCTVHLEAHEGTSKYQVRCSTTADILSGTRRDLHDASLSSQYAFFMGDLNFRTEMAPGSYEGEDDHKAKVRAMVDAKEWDQLNLIDELHRALERKECLVGFRSLFCNFPPTFKVERKSGYDYIDKRRPSYTDRILWKCGHELQLGVKPLLYEAVDDFTSSDHKPVRAAFQVSINDSLKMRPRMSKHRSAVHLSTLLKMKPVISTPTVVQKNKLYLFVSQIECRLQALHNSVTQRSSLSGAPSPYVMLVAWPEEAIKEQVNWRNKLKGFVRMGHMFLKEKADGSKMLLAFGWPSSSMKKNTYEPDWGEEEIQCHVRTHAGDGSPIDLTGSMLSITVIDGASKSDDPVMGTVAFNLANLLRKCVGPDGESHHRPPSERNLGHVTDSGSTLPSKRSALKESRRHSSVFNVFRRRTYEDGPSEDVDDDDDPIISATVDEPLLKNGLEVGQIKCTIEAWWMDQVTARTAATRPSVQGMYPDGIQDENSGDGPRTLLSMRHNDRLAARPKRDPGAAKRLAGRL